jgi:hypothetical protein
LAHPPHSDMRSGDGLLLATRYLVFLGLIGMRTVIDVRK